MLVESEKPEVGHRERNCSISGSLLDQSTVLGVSVGSGKVDAVWDAILNAIVGGIDLSVVWLLVIRCGQKLTYQFEVEWGWVNCEIAMSYLVREGIST